MKMFRFTQVVFGTTESSLAFMVPIPVLSNLRALCVESTDRWDSLWFSRTLVREKRQVQYAKYSPIPPCFSCFL